MAIAISEGDEDVKGIPRQWQEIVRFGAFTSRSRHAASLPIFVRAEPVVGRVFAPSDEQAAVVVVGHGLWQRKFGGQPSAVGQTLRLDSVPYTIIGVLPPSFQFPARDMDAWVPLQPSADERQMVRDAPWPYLAR